MNDMVAEFFATARERHSIYLRRAAGQPRPWTQDPVMHEYRITNVFRELDRTTQWFRKHVRGPLRGRPEVLLATVVFRWFNRVTTGEAIFCQNVLSEFKNDTAFEAYLRGAGDTELLRAAIRASCGDGPYCTGAYMITSPPGLNKLDGMLSVIDNFNRAPCARCGKPDWRCLADRLLRKPGGHTLEQVWRWLKEVPFQGPFHAYEVVTDLRHTALLDRAPDIMTWANPGPGAQRGLNRIHGRRKAPQGGQTARRALRVPIKNGDAQREMQELLAASRDPQYWPQSPTDNWAAGLAAHTDAAKGLQISKNEFKSRWPAWELRDVEMWLCEFDKIMRVRSGDGAPRGRYE